MQDQTQAIVDKIDNNALTLDTTLKIDKVLPQPDRGTSVSRIVFWNLRNAAGGRAITRVHVANR